VAHWIAPGIDQKAAIARIVAAVNQHEALVAQRDELLAACRVGFDVALRFHDEAAADILTAAIANAKAGAV